MYGKIIDALNSKKRICMHTKKQVKDVLTYLYAHNIRFHASSLERGIRLSTERLSTKSVSTLILVNGDLLFGYGYLKEHKNHPYHYYKDVEIGKLIKTVANKE